MVFKHIHINISIDPDEQTRQISIVINDFINLETLYYNALNVEYSLCINGIYSPSIPMTVSLFRYFYLMFLNIHKIIFDYTLNKPLQCNFTNYKMA